MNRRAAAQNPGVATPGLRCLTAVLLLLAIGATARAQSPSVCRITNIRGNERCYGSGTLVHKGPAEAIVLTCAHLFREGVGQVVCCFGGQCHRGEMAAIDEAWDLAVIRVSPPPGDPVSIAREHPDVGEPVTSCGFGTDGRYFCNRGQVLGYVRTSNTPTYETLEISGRAREGDSGGPMLNARGELVGVLFGTDGRVVGGTYCGRIRRFLGGRLPKLFGGHGPLIKISPPTAGPTSPDAAVAPGPAASPVGTMPAATPSPPVAPNPGVATPGLGAAEPPSNERPCPGLDALVGRVDAIEGRLGQLKPPTAAQIAAEVNVSAETGSRFKRLEALLAGVSERVDQVKGGSIDKGTIGRYCLPWLLGAVGLGGFTPAVLLVWKGLHVLRRWRRRRRGDRPSTDRSTSTSDDTAARLADCQRVRARYADEIDRLREQLGDAQASTDPPGDAAGSDVEPPSEASPSCELPHLPCDYAKIWADHFEKDGGNAKHEAIKYDLYREAIQKVRSGELKIPAADRKAVADRIDDWVLERFYQRVSRAVPDENLYQRALLGFLYREAVDALRRGEIQLLGHVEVADAIDAWVRRAFARRLNVLT